MSPLSLFFTIASFVLIADITVAQGAVCTAGIWAAGDVVGYSGLPTHTIDSDGKYLASSSEYMNDDPCKFKIVIRTREDPNDPNFPAAQRIKWMSVEFGVHGNNPSLFERKFKVSQDQGTVKVSGRAMSSTVTTGGCYETGPIWYFCLTTDPSGCWIIDFGLYDGSCEGSVTYCETGAGGNNSGHDQATITINDYYNFQPLYGMCGDGMFPFNCNIGTVDPVTCAV